MKILNTIVPLHYITDSIWASNNTKHPMSMPGCMMELSTGRNQQRTADNLPRTIGNLKEPADNLPGALHVSTAYPLIENGELFCIPFVDKGKRVPPNTIFFLS